MAKHPNIFDRLHAAVEKDDVSIGARLVLVKLLLLSSSSGKTWPNEKFLAGVIGVSKHELKGYVEELQEKNLLRIEESDKTYYYPMIEPA